MTNVHNMLLAKPSFKIIKFTLFITHKDLGPISLIEKSSFS